jgi:hypothetical protein
LVRESSQPLGKNPMQRVSFTCRLAVLCVAVVFQLRYVDAQRAGGAKVDASTMYSILDHLAQQLKLTWEDWRQILTDDGGFKPFGTSASDVAAARTDRERWNGSTWEKRDESGTLRAVGFFNAPNGGAIFLHFFPPLQSRVPMPDPVIVRLMKDAETVTPDDDGVEIRLKTDALAVEGRHGVRVEYLHLVGSIANRRNIVIEWPK